MELYRTGNLAKSKAGHDKDKIYVIIREDDEYVYLSDGDCKKIDNPKKKNKKHVQPIKCDNTDCADNEIIRELIRHYIGGQTCQRQMSSKLKEQ